jgi:tetratricopeptide (TPR) repeat protein
MEMSRSDADPSLYRHTPGPPSAATWQPPVAWQPEAAPAPEERGEASAACLAEREAGVRSFQAGDLQAAIRHLSAARTADPTDYATLAYLGMALGHGGRHAQAAEALTAAARLRPMLAVAQFNLGVALERAGWPAEAAAAYRKALSLDAHHLRAGQALARLTSMRQPSATMAPHCDGVQHSRAGIASLVVGLAMLVASVTTIAAIGAAAAASDQDRSGSGAVATVLGLAIVLEGAVALGGAVLGVVGLCERNRKRIVAGLGVFLNGLVTLMIAALIILGLIAGS